MATDAPLRAATSGGSRTGQGSTHHPNQFQTMDITFFLISIRRLTQYTLGGPSGCPPRSARAPEPRTTAEGLRGVGVSRFRDAGGCSWGANQDHPNSQRPAAARYPPVAMWAYVKEVLSPFKSSPVVRTTRPLSVSRAHNQSNQVRRRIMLS